MKVFEIGVGPVNQITAKTIHLRGRLRHDT